MVQFLATSAYCMWAKYLPYGKDIHAFTKQQDGSATGDRPLDEHLYSMIMGAGVNERVRKMGRFAIRGEGV